MLAVGESEHIGGDYFVKTWKDLVAEARREVTLRVVQEVKEKFDMGEAFILIDVREPDEYQKGHIPGSTNVPRGVLEMTVEEHIQDPQKQIILHCMGGGRSAVAAQSLRQMGYQNVASMEGGFRAWAQSGYPVES